ncbi:MAG: MBL fold metallo-hydrolase [Clostridia bacterium]|nr:MBL fold metallo-hydrolase [Clostridia bacterium]
MNLALCSLASGSSGNSYVIYSDEGSLLIDAGISAKQICEGLSKLGLSAEDLNAVLVTHEHSDHIKGLAVLSKKTKACLYGTEATLECIGDEVLFQKHPIEAGESFMVADMEVRSFAVSHDAADPVGYSVSCSGSVISVVTDTGVVNGKILETMAESDILVLESNHDESILRVGRYPWFLKQRILGEKGHLSNDSAAKALAAVLKRERNEGRLGKRQVLLAHLSKENNFPEMALATMENILEEEGVATGNDVRVEVLSRSQISPIYSV